jgi:nucleotide-binding universal stress UspA family protein
MKKARRILVGLKTPDHAVALTDMACRIAAHNATLFLIHVIELPDPTPLDADVPDLESAARKILGAGERVARRSGLKVQSRTLRAHDAGAALLDEMKERKADLSVIGFHRRRSLGEFLLGTAAQHIARHAPCHLVCVIPPRT